MRVCVWERESDPVVWVFLVTKISSHTHMNTCFTFEIYGFSSSLQHFFFTKRSMLFGISQIVLMRCLMNVRVSDYLKITKWSIYKCKIQMWNLSRNGLHLVYSRRLEIWSSLFFGFVRFFFFWKTQEFPGRFSLIQQKMH